MGEGTADVDRISHVVGIHHTYDSEDTGMDFRILLEADACVNMYEKDASPETQYAILRNVFQTETGKRVYVMMFGLIDAS